MNYLLYEIAGLFVYNLFIALIYGIDKLKAKRDGWRISEKALITLAFLLGGAGAMLGMVWFNHKTAKPKFRILVPIAFILNIVIYLSFFWESIGVL